MRSKTSRPSPVSSAPDDAIAGVVAGLHERQHRLTRLLDVITRLLEAGTLNGDEAAFCATSCEHIVRELPVSYAALFLVDGTTARPYAAWDEAALFDAELEPLDLARAPALRARVERALASGRIDIARDWSPDARQSVHQAFAVAPVSFRGLRLAALVVGHVDADGIDPELVAALRMLGRVLGQLLVNERAMREAYRDLQGKIEELERARDAARASEHAKSRFVANMSHELRTPMNGILGMTAILREGPLEADQQDCVEAIETCGQSLVRIVEDVLDFSRLEAGTLSLAPEPFDLRRLVGDLATMTQLRARERNLRLLVQIDEDVPETVVTDPVRLRQVLTNLLDNAVKFTDAGHVALSVTRADRRDGRDVLLFAVSDTGIGIPEEQIEAVFDRFHQVDASTTRRYGGAGLGLAIAREIVRLLGGRIEVRSRPGAGSTFSFEVPCGPEVPVRAGLTRATEPEPEPEPPEPSAAGLRERLAGLRVLIADDNPVNRTVVTDMLRRLRCRVAQAHSGPEALRAVRRETFDLILMDVEMPGTDGPETARRIRAEEARLGRGPGGLIVALTAHQAEVLRRRCVESGMDEVLEKPLTARALLRLFETAGGPVRAGADSVD